MRKSGILMPIFSLPSRYGIGDFSKKAYEFADFLKESGQQLWQILPLGPTGYGDSPYQSFSAFAGNPYMISLDKLIEDGLLTKKDCDEADLGCQTDSIDYGKIYQNRFPLLRKAFEISNIKENSAYNEFCTKASFWLDDYALFMSIKKNFGGCEWLKWQEDARLGNNKEKYREELAQEIEFHKFLQYEFACQWKELKQYINSLGISIIGDIPIYVAMDSSDTWANPELFQLNEAKTPTEVAGCPPDGFSAKGQLWGNPLYNWEKHKNDGFAWWISRIRHCFDMYDYVRIDHFRGFDEYYSIPYGSADATVGKWKKAPGKELFEAIKKAMGQKNIIAEDLGFITPSVKNLLDETGFMGIKVLEFAFDKRDTGVSADYLPHNYQTNSAAYTATHDNETLVSWYKELDDNSKANVRRYLWDKYTPEDEVYKPLTAAVMRSASNICIIPMQDILGLGDETRLNTPSTTGNNWKWRLKEDMLTADVSNYLKEMTETYGRCKK